MGGLIQPTRPTQPTLYGLGWVHHHIRVKSGHNLNNLTFNVLG